MDWKRGEFTISTDKSRLQFDVIQSFLANDSYWAKTRTPEQTRTAIENSICFGLYHDDQQIGFARVVSDQATFAYLGDVFVLNEFVASSIYELLLSFSLYNTILSQQF